MQQHARPARSDGVPAAKRSAGNESSIAEWKDKIVSVITNDGRRIIGTLRGYDQLTNVILEKCHEHVYSPDTGVEIVPLGLYIIRGDNIAIVGEFDQSVYQLQDLSKIRGNPLHPISH